VRAYTGITCIYSKEVNTHKHFLFVYTCVCVCVCVCVCMYMACMYAHKVRVCAHKYAHTCTHTRGGEHTHTYTHSRFMMCMSCSHTCTNERIYNLYVANIHNTSRAQQFTQVDAFEGTGSYQCVHALRCCAHAAQCTSACLVLSAHTR
jgi:hypothetical protein